MKAKIYAVWDVKAKAYCTPSFELNRALALRTFNDIANDIQTKVHKHPHDFILFEIGEFDDNTGEIIGKKPESLGFPNNENEKVINVDIQQIANGMIKTEVK